MTNEEYRRSCLDALAEMLTIQAMDLPNRCDPTEQTQIMDQLLRAGYVEAIGYQYCFSLKIPVMFQVTAAGQAAIRENQAPLIGHEASSAQDLPAFLNSQKGER